MSATSEGPGPGSGGGVHFDYVAALLGPSKTRQIVSMLAEAGGGVDVHATMFDYITTWKIFNASVELSGDESHRLSDDGVPLGNFELLMASMLQGENLLDGFRRMAAGAKILRPDLTLLVSVYSGRPHLSIGFAAPTTMAKEVYVEALVVVLHCAARWALGRPVQPEHVRGAAGIDPRNGSLLALLSKVVRREGAGVTLTYGEDDGLARFQPRAFSRWHDATFAEYTRLVDAAANDAPPPIDEIVGRVRTLLLEGRTSQLAVGRHLGMSVPTLRRRLADHGASFREIVASVRRDAAEVLLLGDKSVEEIAAELGLSDSRCFRRACRAWFGGAPSDVRRTFRAEAGHTPSRTA